jgi:hypothetical protein
VAAFLNKLGKEGALEDLVLDSFHLTKAIMTGISHCHQLRTLHLKNLLSLDRPVMLGILPDLHDLIITVADEFDHVQSYSSPCLNPSLGSMTLDALKNLKLVGGPPMIQDILDAILMSRNLQTLHIDFTVHRFDLPPKKLHRKFNKKPKQPNTLEDTLEANPYQLFENLVTNILLGSSLKSFTLGFDASSYQYVQPARRITFPFSNLQNLEKLDLSRALLPIDDLGFNPADLDGKLWPRVQHLRLPLVSKSHFFPTAISLSTLAVIAKSFSSLKSFECLLQVDKPLSSFPPAPANITSHPLQTLSVGSSVRLEWSDNRTIAYYLDALFPNLVDIKTHPSLDPQTWEDVFGLVQMCQQARKYEREREAQRQDGK